MDVLLNQPDSMTITADVDLKAPGGATVVAHVQGGIKPYSFKWTKDGVEFSRDSMVLGLSPGEYILELTDSNQCKVIQNYRISDPSSAGHPEWENIRCYPVPAKDHLILEIPGQGSQAFVVQLLSLSGQVLKEYRDVLAVRQHKLDLRKIASGTYVLRVSDARNTRDIQIQIIQSK